MTCRIPSWIIPTFLFDFSGTIADDLVATWLTVCEILQMYGKPSLTLQEFRGIFSLPYWKIFVDLGLPEQIAKVKCLKLYKKLIKRHTHRIKVFSDVRPVLKTLSKIGNLGIVSQTPREVVKVFLKEHNLKQYFSKIVGLEDSAEQKPSPLPLLIASEYFGSKLCETIYIADEYEGILAARSGRMIPVAISRKHSYHTYPKLVSSRPSFLISDLRELTSLEVFR